MTNKEKKLTNEIKEAIYESDLLLHKERWKRIYIDGVKTDYKISSHGRLINEKTNYLFTPSKDSGGKNNEYYIRKDIVVNGIRKTCSIHRLVAMYFCKIPKRHREAGLTFDDLVPNHKDGIKWHNASFNLEWVTQKENMNHAFKEELCTGIFGEESHLAKITKEDAIRICELIQEGKNNKTISNELNVTERTVQHIRSGECWKAVSKDYNFPKLAPDLKYTVPEETIHKICELLEKGVRTVDIVKCLGVKREYVKDIKTHRRRKDISKNYNF